MGFFISNVCWKSSFRAPVPTGLYRHSFLPQPHSTRLSNGFLGLSLVMEHFPLYLAHTSVVRPSLKSFSARTLAERVTQHCCHCFPVYFKDKGSCYSCEEAQYLLEHLAKQFSLAQSVIFLKPRKGKDNLYASGVHTLHLPCSSLQKN